MCERSSVEILKNRILKIWKFESCKEEETSLRQETTLCHGHSVPRDSGTNPRWRHERHFLQSWTCELRSSLGRVNKIKNLSKKAGVGGDLPGTETDPRTTNRVENPEAEPGALSNFSWNEPREIGKERGFVITGIGQLTSQRKTIKLDSFSEVYIRVNSK